MDIPFRTALLQQTVDHQMIHRLVAALYAQMERAVRTWQSHILYPAPVASKSSCNSRHLPCLLYVDHVYPNLSPCLWCAVFILHYLVEDLSDPLFSFLRRNLLICSALSPLLSPAFPRLRQPIASWISLVVNSGICSKFSGFFVCFHNTFPLFSLLRPLFLSHLLRLRRRRRIVFA